MKRAGMIIVPFMTLAAVFGVSAQNMKSGSVPEEMVLVPAGMFMMGSNNGDSDEKPPHRVTISKPFYIGKYEVTQAEWESVMGHNPSNWKGDNLPVECVIWEDAVDYCNKRSESEGLTPCYNGDGSTIYCDFSANGYRLPTEAEWEWAARGGGKGLHYEYSGNNDADAVAWYYYNSGRKTHPVGQKQANSLGLYDMSGNVCEWCWDWYKDSYDRGYQIDPVGAASGACRILRGGGWFDFGQDLRFLFSFCMVKPVPCLQRQKQDANTEENTTLANFPLFRPKYRLWTLRRINQLRRGKNDFPIQRA